MSSDLSRGFVSMSLENPTLVVLISEFKKRKAELFSVPKRLEPKKVLLENSNEPLGTNVYQ